MLAADAHLELGAGLSAALDAPAHQQTYAFDIERLEWIRRKHAGLLFIHIVRQKPPGIIARQAHRGLREVVRAKREKVRDLRDLVGKQSRTGQLNHSPDKIWQLDAGLLDEIVGDATRGLLKDGHLF